MDPAAATGSGGVPREDADRYQQAIAAERRIYDSCLQVHDLAPIFHYWSNKHIRPKLKEFGFESAEQVFADALRQQCERTSGRLKRFISLGCGNCDFEIQLARRCAGSEFLFECCDLNPVMLERGRISAAAAGFSGHFRFTEADLNQWAATEEYDAVLANQSLHHVVNLEHVFREIRRSLVPSGTFLISDMIGRNGHKRWPEALAAVHEFWRRLPPSYRWNRALRQYEEMFLDWDCSLEGFEGVRAQDILLLLAETFHFSLFMPYGNIIDPFVDRSFGFHFDPHARWDRDFIDEVHRRDEEGIVSGRWTPTHLIATAGANPCGECRSPAGLTPGFCLRLPKAEDETSGQLPVADPYQWDTIPHDRQRELEIACMHLEQAAALLRERTAWGFQRDGELDERTRWAMDLEKDLRKTIAWGQSLDAQLQERTGWAMTLKEDLTLSEAALEHLRAELEERTEWARRLDAELGERTSWALRLDKKLKAQRASLERLRSDLVKATLRRAGSALFGYLRRPLRLLARAAKRASTRFRTPVR